jgi:hypothetical protein
VVDGAQPDCGTAELRLVAVKLEAVKLEASDYTLEAGNPNKTLVARSSNYA